MGTTLKHTMLASGVTHLVANTLTSDTTFSYQILLWNLWLFSNIKTLGNLCAYDTQTIDRQYLYNINEICHNWQTCSFWYFSASEMSSCGVISPTMHSAMSCTNAIFMHLQHTMLLRVNWVINVYWLSFSLWHR